jgi:hypothetical protein
MEEADVEAMQKPSVGTLQVRTLPGQGEVTSRKRVLRDDRGDSVTKRRQRKMRAEENEPRDMEPSWRLTQ